MTRQNDADLEWLELDEADRAELIARVKSRLHDLGMSFALLGEPNVLIQIGSRKFDGTTSIGKYWVSAARVRAPSYVKNIGLLRGTLGAFNADQP